MEPKFRRKFRRAEVHWQGYNTLDDVAPMRLKLFGAVCIEYNCLEDIVDGCVLVALSLDPKHFRQVTSRINGMDGKLAIINHAARQSGVLAGEPADLVVSWTSAVSFAKQARDAMIHARLEDPKADIVPTYDRRGDSYQIDIRNKTLKGVVEYTTATANEATAIFNLLSRHVPWTIALLPNADAPSTIVASPKFQDALAQVRERQSHRLSLPALPALPPEPPAEQ